MGQYISKSTLVAEIEKVIDEPAPSHDQQCQWEDGYYSGLYKAESIIDSLGVKEVDLTNAFIEKACDWLRNYINPIARTYLFDDDIEKFRKTMKGE